MKLTSLGNFGAAATEVDLSAYRDSADAKVLIDALMAHHVLVFRDQNLDKIAFDQFGRMWGKPIDFFVAEHRDNEFPSIITVSNEPSRMKDGAAFWHVDGSYDYVPSSFTMLYASEAPLVGGQTRFADLMAAYDALSDEMKARIDGLQVRHRLWAGERGPDEKQSSEDDPEAQRGIDRARDRPIHPLVLRHPIDGRKTLYAIAGSAYAIVGMDDAQGRALLAELKTHALQPRFRMDVKANTGDVLIWDNHCVMHAASFIEHSLEDGKRRVLHRISTTGLPPIFQDRAPAFRPPEVTG